MLLIVVIVQTTHKRQLSLVNGAYLHSLVLVLGLIGLAYDPRDEQLGLLPGLGQQLEGDHIQHLDGLVEFSVQFPQVVEPDQEEGEDRQNHENVEQDRAQADHSAALVRQAVLPHLQHRHQGRHHVQLVGQPHLPVHRLLRRDEVLGVDLIAALELAADEGLALGEVGGGEGEDGAEVAEVDGVVDGGDVDEVEGEDVVVEGLQVVVGDHSLVIQLQGARQRLQVRTPRRDVVVLHLKHQVESVVDRDRLRRLLPLRQQEIVVRVEIARKNQHQH